MVCGVAKRYNERRTLLRGFVESTILPYKIFVALTEGTT